MNYSATLLLNGRLEYFRQANDVETAINAKVDDWCQVYNMRCVYDCDNQATFRVYRSDDYSAMLIVRID